MIQQNHRFCRWSFFRELRQMTGVRFCYRQHPPEQWLQPEPHSPAFLFFLLRIIPRITSATAPAKIADRIHVLIIFSPFLKPYMYVKNRMWVWNRITVIENGYHLFSLFSIVRRKAVVNSLFESSFWKFSFLNTINQSYYFDKREFVGMIG